ncbi:MAG: NAD(P)-dependent oxidoreductase [Planctomycetota bacterium]|jgi:3-hydroxyisobutyrate dehydrogenase-like beta-hydroxyacid dehydrogenase
MCKIGLIGIGLVGTAIAERLLSNNFEVVGFDIVSTRCRHLTELGAKAVSNPAEVAHETDRVVLSLPNTAIVREVIEGAAGILEAKTPPKYIIDTTTGDPEETIALTQRLAQHEIYLLDSTISGSSRQVRDKEAVFMIGGEKAAFETCMDIFQTLSEKVFYLGLSGNGSKAKLASNLILGLNRAALAEGLVFAGKLGLEPEAFLEMLKATPAYSAAMDTKGKKMLNDDFKAESRILQHHKDVSLILKYAKMAGQELPLSSVHFDVLEKAIAAGDGELDNAAIIREMKRRKRN